MFENLEYCEDCMHRFKGYCKAYKYPIVHLDVENCKRKKKKKEDD